MRHRGPKPFCARVGCPNRIKQWAVRRRNGTVQPIRYCSPACVPATIRGQNLRGVNARISARLQRERYRVFVERLAGRVIKQAELYAALAEFERRGWERGYRTCDRKWLKRQKEAA